MSDKKPKVKPPKSSPTKSSPTKSSHKNGKGDSPRNISEKFKKNYQQIKWRK